MTVQSCKIHNCAFEDEATYEDNPPPARCPMCVHDERVAAVSVKTTELTKELADG